MIQFENLERIQFASEFEVGDFEEESLSSCRNSAVKLENVKVGNYEVGNCLKL